MNDNKAIYIDTRTRDLTASVVRVTQVADGKLVLREAVRLPSIPSQADLYIVDLEGYSAESSAGLVWVKSRDTDYSICGELMIDQRGGLRPVAPRKCALIVNGELEHIKTATNSNYDVASAAWEGIRFAWDSGMYGEDARVLVSEGQSDYTKAFVLRGRAPVESDGSFEDEHQTHIINDNTIRAAAVLESYYWSKRGDMSTAEYKHHCLVQEVIHSLKHDVDLAGHKLDKELAFHVLNARAKQISRLELEEYVRDYLNEHMHLMLIDGTHSTDSHLSDPPVYTWVVPNEMAADIQVGGIAEADTAHGEKIIHVKRMYKGLPGRHRRVIKSVQDE